MTDCSRIGGVLVLAAVVAGAGCSSPEAARPADPAPARKVPITTASAEARSEYLEGRNLVERLQIQNSIAHFDKAIAADPSFALAELGRANSSPTGAEFFAHLAKAVSLADKASDGERLMIQAANAGASGRSTEQARLLEQLVAAYPDDERAQFALGTFDFGQQDYKAAIEHFSKASTLDAQYSAPYNLLGYSYKQVGDFAHAETAFRKYIELIPDDPNPYDSYGELLLKMGRFDDSIVQYRKALDIDPHFQASHVGIAADLMYSNKPDAAIAELAHITDGARNDGERRTALFAETVVEVDRGRMDRALALMDSQYAIAEKTTDTAGMTGDLGAKAAIYLQMGKPDQARAAYDKALALVDASTLPDAVKANAHLVQHGSLARVALAKKDTATARTEADALLTQATAAGNAFQVRQAHEIAGMIALAEKQYDTAIAELQQASLQNPYNLYRLALAYEGKGDREKAAEQRKAAATFNPLPQLNFAFVRTKAAAGMGT